eukprot:351112-Chlamydomonas_euryale.AAC.2
MSTPVRLVAVWRVVCAREHDSRRQLARQRLCTSRGSVSICERGPGEVEAYTTSSESVLLGAKKSVGKPKCGPSKGRCRGFALRG